MTADSRENVTVYTPASALRQPSRLIAAMFRDIWRGRGLAWRLAVRDISAQYRQAASKVGVPEFALGKPIRSGLRPPRAQGPISNLDIPGVCGLAVRRLPDSMARQIPNADAEIDWSRPHCFLG